MKHTLSTFEAENRCLDMLAQPELKKRGCFYKKMCTPKKALIKSNFVAYFVKVYKDLCSLSDVSRFIVMATVLF